MARENRDDFIGSFDEKYKEWVKYLKEAPGKASEVLEWQFKGSSKEQPKPSREETGSELPDQTIHGFENEMLSLKDFLLNQKESEEFKTLAVVGKYGVGKTALCQKIFNDEDVKKAYVPRVWVCMYTKEELREDAVRKVAIVKRILRNLGVDEDMLAYIKDEASREMEMEGAQEEKELSRLLYALHLNLWGKKYLIVLDDARSEDGWDERINEKEKIPEGKEWGTHLSCGFPKGFGGRVIFTSRDEELAEKLVGGKHNLHRLYPLSDVDSVWKIYMAAAGRSKFNVNPMDEKKYKKDLMDKSCGIPYAAITLGTIEPVDLDELAVTSMKKGSSHGRSAEQKEEKTGSSRGKTTRETLSEQDDAEKQNVEPKD